MLFSLFFFFAVLNVVLAATNRTIDDTLGDSLTGVRPKYFPSDGVWEDATCKGCAIQPDPSLAFDGTWTAATYNPTINTSIELSFKGTAIYVFFILANNVAPGITTDTECNFTLDGLPRGTFTHQPDQTNFDLQYNQLVFSATSLVNVNHTLVISTSGVDHDVFINFDFANYTVPDELPATTSSLSSSAGVQTTSTGSLAGASARTSPSASTSSSTPTGAIVGIVIGVVVVLAIIAALIFYWRRQRQRRISYYNSDHTAPSFRSAFDINPFPAYQPSVTSPSYLQNTTTESSSQAGWGRRTPTSDIYATVSSRSSSRPTHQRRETEMSVSQYSQPTPALPTSMRNSATYGGVEEQQFRIMSDAPLPSQPTTSRQDAAALRQARQRELEDQMRRIKEELRELNNEAAGRRASLASNQGGRVEDDRGLRDLRDQIRYMRSQMDILREQADSPWAQGLSDVPPPGYSPRPTSGAL